MSWPWVFNIGTALIIALGMYKNWVAAKGRLRLLYWLMILIPLLNVGTNIIVFALHPDMWGIMMYNVLMVWQALMGIKGLMRLR